MIRLPEYIDRALGARTVIVPSQQRAYAARLAYSAAQISRGHLVWETPQLLTAEAWLRREVERAASGEHSDIPRPLAPAEEWMIWRQSAAEAARDLELLEIGGLASALRRACNLAADFRIPSAAAVGAESRLLQSAHRLVEEHCRSIGAAPASSLAQWLTGGAHPEVLGAGFVPLPPRLRALGVTVPSAEPALCTPSAVLARNEWDELERIAAWCHARIERQPDARLLVVFPGSPGRRERLATLIRQAVNPGGWLSRGTAGPDHLVGIEGGEPIADRPAVAHALTALSWLAGRSVEFAEISEWLRAPYWDAPDADARARLDSWLRGCGLGRGHSRDWARLIDQAPAAFGQPAREWMQDLRSAGERLTDDRAAPRTWSERFRSALEALHWPGDRTRDSGEQQTLQRFFELLEEFGQLTGSRWHMGRAEAVELLRELAHATAFRPADDDAVVTLTSALADPVVIYDGIWVAGLHADVFPQPVQPDAFVPFAAQVDAGIPAASAAGRYAEAAALLRSWRASTAQLVISAPERADDLELLPSPLWAGWLSRDAAGAQASGRVWLADRLHRAGQTECVRDDLGVPWPPAELLPAGTRSLELQNLCPFRAYAELRLGSAELDEPEPGVAPDVRGRMLHAALEKLWRQLRDSQTLADYNEERLDSLIERVVAEAAAAELPGSSSSDQHSPLLLRERRRAVRLIRALCALERRRPPFRVEDTETQRTFGLASGRISVRIDRVDVLESGGRAILDYKSGKRAAGDWYGDRPSHPQLIAYLAALGEDVVAMATVNVTAREVRFDGIAASGSLLPYVRGVKPSEDGGTGDAWQHWRGTWLARIGQLADDFLAGRAAVDPKSGACKFCHAISICRISDRVALDSDETAAGEGVPGEAFRGDP